MEKIKQLNITKEIREYQYSVIGRFNKIKNQLTEDDQQISNKINGVQDFQHQGLYSADKPLTNSI